MHRNVFDNDSIHSSVKLPSFRMAFLLYRTSLMYILRVWLTSFDVRCFLLASYL